MITPTDFTLLDSINYALSLAIDQTKGIYFLSYNHVSNKYSVHSLNDLWKTIDINNIRLDNIFKISLEHSQGIRGENEPYIITDFEELNETTSTRRLEITKDFTFKKFDHIQRKWIDNNVNFKSLFNSLPTPQRWNKFKKDIRNINDQSGVITTGVMNARREVVPQNPFPYHNHMKELFMYSNVIQFKVRGEINRHAGEICWLNLNPNDSLYYKHTGAWLILRTTHRIEQEEYITTVQAARLDRLPDQRGPQGFVKNV
jgi:hypothetical protein